MRREQVAFLEARGQSRRHACALLSVARSSVGYASRLAVRDAPALAVMRELADQYPRFGYRRIRIFLARHDHPMSVERAHRLWRVARLQVPRRRPRKRVASGRPRPVPATGPNHVWAYDFVFDACANGQQLKCLTVLDEFTRDPWHRAELLNQSIFDIVTQYQSVYRGVVNFYRLAHNLRDVAYLHGIMQHSLTRTLAAKLRISVPAVYRRYHAKILGEDGTYRAGLEVRVARDGKPPLIARWGGISLAWSIDATLDDRVVPFRFANTTEIVQRLLAERCELCGSQDRIQVHHIRALKDLKRNGRADKPLWVTVMAARRRKTLVLCHACHVDVHGGRLSQTTSLSGHRRAG